MLAHSGSQKFANGIEAIQAHYTSFSIRFKLIKQLSIAGIEEVNAARLFFMIAWKQWVWVAPDNYDIF